VDSSVVDAYTDELVARVRLLRQGDPSREDVELGPVINERQAARIEAIIADARDRGATVLVGGGRSGLYVQPTVLSGVRPGMRAYDEEVFGPVAVLIVADGESDAIRIANDTPYGLSASVHGRDAARAHMVADRIQSGMVHVNGQPINDNPWAPMGGVKASGVGGRFGAVADVEMFSTLRWRTVHDDTPQGFFPRA
jgi:benzaldehyde dehydrogenase (NAD)